MELTSKWRKRVIAVIAWRPYCFTSARMERRSNWRKRVIAVIVWRPLLLYLSQNGTEKLLMMANNLSLCLEASFALPQLGWNREFTSARMEQR
jgi:hypothetical protein